MKKLVLVLLMVFTISLSSCTADGLFCNINPDLEMCYQEYTPITDDTEGIIQSLGVLNIIDSAEDFDLSLQTLHTFRHLDNEDILYVDIQEFLYVLQDALVYYQVTTTDTIEITYIINYSGNIFGGYEYSLVIDPVENTIYYNDFNFGGNFNSSSNIDYDSDLNVVDNEYIEGDVTKTIDLDDYDITIAKEEEVFFIPLYLANMLFTGDYLNVYQSGNNLYVVDDFYANEDIINTNDLGVEMNEQNIIRNTVNYTALFFDYYYGLKDFLGITSFKEELTTRGFYDAQSLVELDVLLQEFMFSLNDLHSSIVAFGYNSDAVQTVMPPDDNKLWDLYDVYLSDECLDRTGEFNFTEYDEYYILELNEFTLDTLEYMQNAFVDIDATKPIYIDLACNVGGNLVAVFEVLMYMTNDPVDFRYTNPSTGEIYVESYQLDTGRAVTNDFYIFTSAATFSAANLTASMARDNALAMILGTHTSGGACSIIYTVLPNNMVLTHSSQFAMIDKDNLLIEAGLAPDYMIDYSISLEETLEHIYLDIGADVFYGVTEE